MTADRVRGELLTGDLAALLSLEDSAMPARAALVAMCRALADATFVGDPAPVVARMAGRIRAPQVGDLVVEHSTFRAAVHDPDPGTGPPTGGDAMRRITAATLLTATLLLAGCSNPPTTGTVTDKRYTPAHSQTHTWCHPVGKVTVCEPRIDFYPDTWELCITNSNETGWRTVDHVEYDRYAIGDHYPKEPTPWR